MKKGLLFILTTIISFTISMQFSTIRHWVYKQFTHHILYKKTVPLITFDKINIDKDIILDTRSKEEYAVSQIKNAQFIDFDKFDEARIKTIPKDKKIILYCSVGYRSERIGEKMQALGYKNVYNLDGGLFTWVNQKQPIYQTDNTLTKAVHPFSSFWGFWLTKGEKVYTVKKKK